MSNTRKLRREVARGSYSAPKSKFKQMEEVLRNGGTPSDLYALIPERQKRAFEYFARNFGYSREDIERLTTKG